MGRKIELFLIILAGLCGLLFTQTAQAGSDNQTGSPVAYVYVSSSPDGTPNTLINGYAAARNGRLSPIPGSPFFFHEGYLAVTGSWLYGVRTGDFHDSGQSLDAYSIAADGSLTAGPEDNVPESGGAVLSIYFDHTGSSLYADYYTTNNDFLSYSVDHESGELSYVDTLFGGPPDNSPVSFIGNNRFAYSSSCYHFSPLIIGVQRENDGALSYLDMHPPFPRIRSGQFWCPWRAAADPTNHLAIAMQPFTSDWNVAGPFELASYTVDRSGNLTTTNTRKNMPKVLVGQVNHYWMSPSGKLLAVGGSTGLEVFHFNGANPITKFTGLLTSDGIDQLWWDNVHHLYAISRTSQKLYVFTVTAKGATQAPGSPHKIVGPVNVIVLPKE
jgi:hypothetical protein